MRHWRLVITLLAMVTLLVAACAPAAAPTPTPTKAPEKAAATPAAPQPTAAAPTPTAKAAEPKPPVVLGVILSLVGPAGGMGSLHKQGFELAQEEINAAGGIDGRKLEFIVEDDEGQPAKAATAATKLIQKDKVVAILGPGTTVTSAAAAQVANAEKVVAFAVFSGDQLTAPGSGIDYLFRIGWPDRYTVGKLVQYGAKKYNKIGVLADSGPAGQSVAEAAIKGLKELGKEVVGTQSFDTRAPDMTPQLLNLQKAGAEALIVQALPGDAPTVLKGMKQIGYNAQVLGHLGFADPTIRLVTPDAAQGVLAVTSEDPTKPEQQRVIEAFKKKYGSSDTPLYWNILHVGYDTVKVMAEALKRANFDRDKVKGALESIKDFPAVNGSKDTKISFGPGQHDGTGADAVILVQVKGKDLVKVE